MSSQGPSSQSSSSARLSELLKPVVDLDEGLLVSATYDGERKVAVLKFYDPKNERVWLWYDNTGHRPYCYTRLPLEELAEVRTRRDITAIEAEEKLDLLADSKITVRKIVATDPLAIGGSSKSVRDEIRAWEADIKYYENYIYDKGLLMGTYYRINKGELSPMEKEMPELVSRSLGEILTKSSGESTEFIKRWAELLGQPLSSFRRIATDIEVANEEGRVPDPEKADREIIAVSFYNDTESLVYLYFKGGTESSIASPTPYKSVVFSDEAAMLRAAFSKMLDYPMLITFNGDDFDLRYLKHRAENLGIKEEEIPIQLQRQEASLKHGLHIDLYRFFNNRSIQIYVYGNRYSEHTLNGIAEALLGRSKLEFEGNIGDLPLIQLANYCLNDSQLTYELTSASSSLLMKILIVLSRIARMPMTDVARLGVSNWIRSMMFYEHRRMGALIPRTDELAEKGGATSEAIIKGKKYKGGLVIEPKPGVHFGVSVLDFASLVHDESIFVRKRQTGQVYKAKIGEFVDQRLPNGEGFAAKEIGPTWDVLSFDYESQQASWKTVTAVIRHSSQDDVLEVVTESGRRVSITKGHSVITLDLDGRKKTVRGSDLKIGDYLVVLSSFCAEQHDTSLDLLPYLRQLRGYRITRGVGGHGRTVILTARRSHRKFVLLRYLTLTSELMWGLGYWLAEGWFYRNKYVESLRIEASSSDVELAESKFNMAGFRTWTSKSKTAGWGNLGIGGRYDGAVNALSGTIFAKLVRIWFGNHACDKRIPDWVLQLPVEMRRALIDGYYKGDGFNSTVHGQFAENGRYKVGGHSRLLMDTLMSLGLVTGFHCFSKTLGDPESYLRWSNDGTDTYRKTRRPPPELMVRSEHVRSFAKTPYYDSHRQQPSRYERVNRTSVEAYEQPFERFYVGNCHFEKVKKITAVKNKLPVYDISVKGSESFFNCDGILVSNSLYPSIIKVHNLSYDTVNCTHPECRSNQVPETTHWVCTRRRGITSLVVGSLRDLRVSHYKHLAKDPKLSKDDRELYSVVSQGLKVFLNACFTGDTEVVTPDGVRNIRDMKVGDRVINVNPETLQIEIDRVVEVQRFSYQGEMYHFKDRRFVDLKVTPNHRFLVRDMKASSKAGTVFRTAEEIFKSTNMVIPKLRGGIEGLSSVDRISLLDAAKKIGAFANIYPADAMRLSSWFIRLSQPLKSKIRCSGAVNKNRSKIVQKLHSHYRVPSCELTEDDIDEVERAGGFVLLGQERASKIPARYDSADFASLCGWFVSEGYPVTTEPKFYPNGGHRGTSSGIVITQSFGRGNAMGLPYRAEIRRLLDGLGLRHITDSGDEEYFKVSNAVLHRWMVDNCYVDGEPTHTAASKRIPDFVFSSRRNLESFFDSCYKGDGSRRNNLYTTTSVRLAKDMVVLLTYLGAKTKIIYEPADGVYRVIFKNVSAKLTSAGSGWHRFVKKFEYEGEVCCVTTEKNHTIIAGRNGRFVHVGQSYGVMGFETFALYCLPVAEATAAFGRYAITRTIEKCKELGIGVVYSDSVTGERCITLQDPRGIIRVMPIEEFFALFGSSAIRRDGKEEVHPGRWKALSIDPLNGVAEFKPVRAVIRHMSFKRVYRVFEKWGCTRVTEDHSLLVSENDKIVLAKPTELGGKNLLRADHIPPVVGIRAIDVYEELKPYVYSSIYKGREKHLQAHCDKEWVWYGWTKRKDPIKVKRFILVGTPELRALVELLGAYVAEGSSSTPDTTRSRMGASLSCSDVGWLNHLRGNYAFLFKGTTSTIIRSSQGTRHLAYRGSKGQLTELDYEDRTHKMQMMNELSAIFFKAFCGQKSDGKEIPWFIYHLPNEYKRIFLENMVKGDGSRVFGAAYSDEYREKNFRYETKSLKLAGGMSVLLGQLGIRYTVRYRKSKQTYCFATSELYNRRRSTPVVIEEPHDGYVYDLSVDENHTFVDSCGNIALKNTDSLFTENPSPEAITKVTNWAEVELGVELDLDKSYRYVAFSERKKNYFGVLQDGTADIKGLTGKKSQTPEFLKKTFYEALDILGKVYGPDDFERARTSIKALLMNTISRLRNREIPVEQLAFNVMIGKSIAGFSGTTPQHVKAAKLLQDRGREIKAGDIISYVKTKTPPNVKPASMAKLEEVDVEKYLEYGQSMFDQMLDALGFSFDEIMGSTTLDLFWSGSS